VRPYSKTPITGKGLVEWLKVLALISNPSTTKKKKKKKKWQHQLGSLDHTCNPSYLGEAEIGRNVVQGQLQQKVSETPSHPISWVW
jgi:hypothetical protein